MVIQSDDRRSRRSRKLLKQGLSELLQEKNFSEISVRDITDRMDLNRGTFYLHYTDTYDLLQSLEADVLADIQHMVDEHRGEVAGGDSLRPIFEPLLEYIAEHRALCESLFLNNANSSFIGRVQQLILDNGGDLVRRRRPEAPETQVEYLLDFLALGLIGLMRHWFDTDMRLPKSELLDMADRLTRGAEKVLLG